MAYRHAWRLVDSMNRQAPVPLVVTNTEGGTGAREKAISPFRDTYGALKVFLHEETHKLQAAIEILQKEEETDEV